MKKKLLSYILFIFLISSVTGYFNVVDATKKSSPAITLLSKDSSYPGEVITITGTNFGAETGYVILTGLEINPSTWSDTSITFTIPKDAATGFIYVKDSSDSISNKVEFSVLRDLDEGHLEPYNLEISNTGMLGAAFLVESDGEYLYGISGFETLSTYEICNNDEYRLCSRIYLPQRVGDLRLCNGYLFCSGDHGLLIYSCIDLQNGNSEITAAISGNHFLGVDVKEKNGESFNGIFVALCDYLPTIDTQELNMELYSFNNEILNKIGTFSRPALSTERQHAIAIDPNNPKVYISGGETLLGDDKYILEILIDNPTKPVLNHREETGGLLAFDMEAGNNILWTGVVNTGTELFRTYSLYPGTDHLTLDNIITGAFGLGRTTRVKILDDSTAVGSAWSGARPDVFLLNTYPSSSSPLASYSSLDWAFDVTGYTEITEEYDGKIIVADEWGGFLTYEYSLDELTITHKDDYHWVPASAMTENIHLTDDRVYISNRGAGIWSADRDDLSDETSWKYPEWDFTLEEPQPYPVSGLAIREDPIHGLLIAGLAHEKAMAWGVKIIGILYKESTNSIERLAISEEIDPPGLYSTGESVVWPEQDLVFMTTGSDGIRAYIVNPDEPSITLHKDCSSQGFGTDVFSTNNMAACMQYYNDGGVHKLVIGTIPGLLVSAPTLHVFTINYPEGVPDRNNPDRAIELILESSLQCAQYKTLNFLDITSSGNIAIATNQGIGLFHLSWIPELNNMSVNEAWNTIKIPIESYEPFWTNTWSATMKDVGFADENTIYCVKNPEGKNPGGIWRLTIDISEESMSHTSLANGYYPGVQCGMDYTQFLQGWANPDIVTIHHPYALAVDENGVYVTGWSGKVQKIVYTSDNEPPSTPKISGPQSGQVGKEYTYTASSTDPEGSDLEFIFDWGDGTDSGWQSSNSDSHIWNRQGNFNIRVKARDTEGAESGWGSLSVNMPKSRINNFQFFQYIFDILFNRFSLLKLLFKLNMYLINSVF